MGVDTATIKIHYDGFEAKHDEWIPNDSDRILGMADPKLEEGTKIKALSKKNKERICTIVEVDAASIKIHYEGFPDKYDEWIPKDSERILGIAEASSSPKAKASAREVRAGKAQLDKGLQGYASDDSSGDEEPLLLPASIALAPSEMRRSDAGELLSGEGHALEQEAADEPRDVVKDDDDMASEEEADRPST